MRSIAQRIGSRRNDSWRGNPSTEVARREVQRASVLSSGATGECQERDVLLQGIVSRMDNWEELADEDKAKEKSKESEH
ncbi:hypothetical protein PC116_g10086 [Phytophthora cactorum]|uniref:Uncharacterized protein n=1 Tax=Phytophthora cactorum TaxID=29920 RepID=A0A8T1L2N5_9STRA|nr:hypothetical protein Pcac1_g6571 [Phytophthora cactorum]KAG2916854.1 hypothetical protein PC114_g7334 [Phytophthora cactorum]KAG2946826.1 hypothetical protein PC117_g7292 [Phytophthora cactorum]KAG2989860.1 hypothetical protein PC120_g23080 [Phytophthora cactorum]KAG3028499.1 hypothetical protein PC119_g6969 [Phytophthora cactorum]